MFHLFEVMVDGMSAVYVSKDADSLGGLIVITDKVMEVYPEMWIFWVSFVFIGTISLMALVPAIFVELNLRDAEEARKKQHKKEWEERVEKQRHALELIFHTADLDGSNSVSREEMDEFLATKDVLKRLGLEPEKYIDEEDEEVVEDMMDVRQLRMEFTMVYDALEADGRTELSCEEFIDTFRQMRAKPMDQVVLTLQQEIFKLRTLMNANNAKLHEELKRLNSKLDRGDSSADPDGKPADSRRGSLA